MWHSRLGLYSKERKRKREREYISVKKNIIQDISANLLPDDLLKRKEVVNSS